MSKRPLWDKCIHHRGQAASEFARIYFSQTDRQVLLIGGAGFDPRSQVVARELSSICGKRLNGLFFREERPNPSLLLRSKADANDAEIRRLISGAEVLSVNVFEMDNAPVGGRRATRLLHERLSKTEVTDIVLDASALSVGVMFPIARYCFDWAKRKGIHVNFHMMVVDDPETDASIRATSSGKAAPLHSFNGQLTLDSSTSAAKLWLPQLGTKRREVLKLIYEFVSPHAVCPIIPFPSANPRAGDLLIEEYGDLFDTVVDQMTPAWNVDARDIVYTHERSPLDLYRSVLKIADARERVFAETGGSQLILSPLGSKAVAIGLLMAAIERDFAVVSVETIEYHLEEEMNECQKDLSELVHVWLHGEAYRFEQIKQDA